MILPSHSMLSFVTWIAERLGLALDLTDDQVFDALDESELSEQLRYGRD